MDEEIYPNQRRTADGDLMPGGGNPPPPRPAGQEDRMPGDKSYEEDLMPGAKASGGPSFFSKIKSEKWMLFALMGLGGGVAGAFFAELAPGSASNDGAFAVAAKTGVWTAIAAAFMSVGLFSANDTYNRRKISPGTVKRGAISGAIGGFIAGLIAEGLFQALRSGPSGVFKTLVVYAACWSVLGVILGFIFSRTVPNLGSIRGIAAGGIGGAGGGIGFVIVCYMLPDLFGRMVGIGTLGFSLGVAIVIIEAFFREAALEVVWAPNENTFMNLGAQPIYIGGGTSDEIFVRGLKERHASVVFDQGKIEYIDGTSGKRTPLKNESNLQVGHIKLIVHAAK